MLSAVTFDRLRCIDGVVSIVVWPRMFQQFRREAPGSRLLAVTGHVQRDESGHLVARCLTDLSHHLHALGDAPLPSGAPLARADEAKGGGFERRGAAGKSEMPGSRDFR